MPKKHDPITLKFFTEIFEKEKLLRLNWITKNKEQIKDAATLKRPPKDYYDTDISKKIMSDEMAALAQEHIETGNNRRRKMPSQPPPQGIEKLKHGHSLVDIGLGDPKIDPKLQRPDNDLNLDPIMRPVDSDLKELLNKEKPDFGRVHYLEKRANILPENKYYFPESSNWEYGWRLKDGGKRQRAIHGRYWHLTRSLINRVGPQPDPPYYKRADEMKAGKCTPI